MSKTKHSLEAVKEAIKGSGAVKATIARRLGVGRQTVDSYLARWQGAQDAYDQEAEKNLDMAEGVLLLNIEMAAQKQEDDRAPVDTADAKWYLARKGKDRGYSERQEVTGQEGGPVVIKVVYDSKPSDIGNATD